MPRALGGRSRGPNRPLHALPVIAETGGTKTIDANGSKRRRPERDDDRVGLGGVGYVRRPLDLLGRRDARQHSFGARLVERHPARLNGVKALAVGVNADCSQALVGEGKRKRQAHAAAANNRYVEAHRPQDSRLGCGRGALRCAP